MLNIVIPMAGSGSRFAVAGYENPKPLIEIFDIPMIKIVINNLKPKCIHRFIFIVQRSHVEQYDVANKLKLWVDNAIIIETDGLTDGAACTVLLAKEYINNSDPLMIANSDQYIDCDINNYLAAISDKKYQGGIMTMTADDPKWSFVGFDNSGRIDKVIEKKVISNEATVGIYNYSCGADFVTSAEEMIEANDRVNGEFYVAPTYNYLITKGRNIGVYNIGSEANGMYGLGTPADLDIFLKLPVSLKAIKGL
ncbi:glycosyltransferase family 2 protein [Yersinia enterocolitica]|uniref:glycosyltransferase family 2 protein n=1 Tax=Yersinia enterocolitica TaxID=630 RepID=UPI0028767AA2|nr:glycosyl transferase family 2 [Yersinia enterocolitica]HDL6886102.1 glycosyltransferase family 2 protein [Yersinia enterocolitica]HDL6899469.1 glycosyltransferase family 2 protein [Yersinia enterocolitica]HDL7013169.1 glycosyltransferase family 2 protein [Yersinia enterocolitica]HDL7085026.1 glycosyltransferase family 2 protein [Yersinia enterocolitica]